MKRLAAVVSAVVALPLASCSGGGTSDTYVLSLQGTATVSAPGADTRLDDGRHRLRIGQTVTVTSGSAVLGLPGATSLVLRAGRKGRHHSMVKVAARPTLVDGDALAVAGDGDTLTFESGGATVGLRDGAARVRRSSGTTVAVYQGRATVAALGREMKSPVRALRQVTVADTGGLPRQPVPLVFDRADPDQWDVLYLHDAIDLGGQLQRRASALSSQPVPVAFDAPYLRGIVPALRSARGFSAKLVDGTGRSVAETVVGASIALSGDGDLPARWNSAFGFRGQGADWGLVAADQHANRAAVLGILDGVLNQVTPRFAPVGTDGRTPASTPRPTPTTTPPRTGPAPKSPATAVPVLPPITLPLLPSPSEPTDPVSPPTTPGKPRKKPHRPTPTIPPVTVPTPVQGLLDGLLGNGKGSPPPNALGGLLDTVGGLPGGR
ncbi:MAG: hypothetical protein JWN29_1993 [Acidimicrobiales bacterium]|nr:hypothetical protein [Acidimicrobiales bacterium]